MSYITTLSRLFYFSLVYLNGCFQWMLLNSTKELNRFFKQINSLLIKGNVKYLLKSYYGEKVTYLKLRFSEFKKFVSRSDFGNSNSRRCQ